MNRPSGQDATGEFQRLRHRLQRLRLLLTHQVRAAAGRKRRHAIAGTCVVVAFTIALSMLTSMAFKLDANAITQIGRLEIEKNLPRSRQTVKQYLEAESPRLVSHLLEGLIESVPHLRALLLESLQRKLQGITEEFERNLTAQMEEAVRAGKSQIEQELPDATDVERVERLVTAVGARFNENMESAFEALYPQYARELGNIRVYLESLKDRDPAQLTPRERTHKELIETLLRLTVREQAPGAEPR